MTTFDTRRTPDYSPLVVHFTKGRQMVQEREIVEGQPLYSHRRTAAKERLLSILCELKIHASPMPFLPTKCQAVCFTECIWDGLIALTQQYSPYGIVFSKSLIFDNGGGPALYVRGDTLSGIGDQIPQDLHPFIAPFDPEETLRPGVRLDWLHEREWRLPHSLDFTYANIEYVIVNSLQDASWIVREIGAQHLPERKVIPMEVYQEIRQAWSTA